MRRGYNEHFAIKHNTTMFDYVPSEGDIVIMSDNNEYTILEASTKRILVKRNSTGQRYKISVSNPFEHIRGIVTK